jgi:hypothetical protein
MKGELSLWISLFTMTRYRVFILCYEYPTGLFSLHIYKGNENMKTRKRGIRGSEDKGNEGNGYTLCTRTGLSLLSRADLSCVMFFILVSSPGCQYGVGPAIPLACRYSVYVGPDSVCSSLSYLLVHQHSLLNLSPFRYS